jgi:hypothetical protein
MTTKMKYDLPLLDFDTWFSSWQVKRQVVPAHHDLDEAFEGFGNKDQKTWTSDELRERSDGVLHDPSTTLE